MEISEVERVKSHALLTAKELRDSKTWEDRVCHGWFPPHTSSHTTTALRLAKGQQRRACYVSETLWLCSQGQTAHSCPHKESALCSFISCRFPVDSLVRCRQGRGDPGSR
jgi:hypothetical protein